MFMEEKKSEVTVRKVLQIHGSMYVCIPKKFVDRHGIQAGDRVAMLMGENLKLSLMEKADP